MNNAGGEAAAGGESGVAVESAVSWSMLPGEETRRADWLFARGTEGGSVGRR